MPPRQNTTAPRAEGCTAASRSSIRKRLPGWCAGWSGRCPRLRLRCVRHHRCGWSSG